MKLIFALVFALSFQALFAQSSETLLKRQRLIALSDERSRRQEPLSMRVLSLNRSLAIDGECLDENDASWVSPMVSSKRLRSPIVAAAFSAIAPGAGEFYAESYWRSALFFAAELALWAAAIHYQNKGHRAEREFIAFADSPAPSGAGLANDGGSRWDAVRFARRMSEIYTTDRFLNSGLVSNAAQIRQMAAELGTEARLNEIRNRDYRFLNAFERIAVAATGATLSHMLPPYGDQQYYELIGKYSEYAIGWYDYDESGMDNRFEIRSQRYLEYAAMHGRANQTLKTASTFFSLVVLNHALSVVDALLATHQYNDRVRASIQFRQDAMTQTIYPTASIAASF